jgi:hypothetical protein
MPRIFPWDLSHELKLSPNLRRVLFITGFQYVQKSRQSFPNWVSSFSESLERGSKLGLVLFTRSQKGFKTGSRLAHKVSKGVQNWVSSCSESLERGSKLGLVLFWKSQEGFKIGSQHAVTTRCQHVLIGFKIESQHIIKVLIVVQNWVPICSETPEMNLKLSL